MMPVRLDSLAYFMVSDIRDRCVRPTGASATGSAMSLFLVSLGSELGCRAGAREIQTLEDP